MRTRRRRIRSRAYAAAVLAALAAAIAGPTAALAVPADTQYPRPVPQTTHLTPSDFAAKVGDTPADFGRSVAAAAKVGDTPSDFGRSVAAAAKVGDTPSDFPGATRAQATPPTAVTVVRPERTIVREADSLLPLIVASLALLVALGVAGTALVHQRSVRPGRAG
jgi:hypothetical protein